VSTQYELIPLRQWFNIFNSRSDRIDDTIRYDTIRYDTIDDLHRKTDRQAASLI